MKKIKIILLFLILSLISSTMVSCISPIAERQNPIHFLGSTWESEDKLVRFTVNINPGNYHYGSITNDKNSIEMVFESAVHWFGMQGCSVEDYEKLEPDEYGYINITEPKGYEHYDFIENHGQEHYFIAEVIHSSIYEEGEQITFYRVDETKDIEVREFSWEDYKTQIENHTSNKKLNCAKDIKTAVSQARNALEQEFGPLSDELEVYYDAAESCWLVKDTHWLESFVSVPHIIFHVDGNVLAIWE